MNYPTVLRAALRGLAALALLAAVNTADAKIKVINVRAPQGDATRAIARALDKAAGMRDASQVVVRLQPGVYDLHRTEATPVRYHVSNTTSPDECADPVKHVGILIKDMRNLVIDGQGATLRTHGEMTPWVIDGCSDVILTNLRVEAADPSVPEMTVVDVDSASLTAQVNPLSHYRIDGSGKLYWCGEGWEFTDGIAQIYCPDRNMTLRCGSPVADSRRVSEVSEGVLRFELPGRLGARVGDVYQMRHSFRTEVAGLITESRNVKLSDLQLTFMGNFGIVAQTSTNITYARLKCAPDPNTGRTNAGFADFLQVSGCRGLVKVTDCKFAGSHDDPINIHGTHLRVSDWGDNRRLQVDYMHPQTFGFQSFFRGDTVEIVDPSTLLPVATAVVDTAVMVTDHTIELLLDRTLDGAAHVGNAVIENVSWTPKVEITGCRFTLTPTRGILVTTRRSVTISGNIFERIPMASVLIADDGRSWYESGRVTDVVVRNNQFIDCSWPLVEVRPENSRFDGPVHTGIRVLDNTVTQTADPGGRPAFYFKDSSHIRVGGNKSEGRRLSVEFDGCTNASVVE